MDVFDKEASVTRRYIMCVCGNMALQGEVCATCRKTATSMKVPVNPNPRHHWLGANEATGPKERVSERETKDGKKVAVLHEA